jgi:hypothetical protein
MTSKGGDSGAVDSDWEAADGAEGDSLKVVDCLGEVALAAVMMAMCWECMVGAQTVHLWDPLAEQARSASGLWSSLRGP